MHPLFKSKDQRPDGRKSDESRSLKLETDAIKTADSSSLVKLGNTTLVCGCILETSDRDNDDKEAIRFKLKLPHNCSDSKGLTGLLLKRTLKNILEDSNCIDKQSLKSNETVDLEIICLNYDGSLLDASLVAILLALESLKFPSDKDSETRSIKFNSVPICSSFAMVDDRIVCDPNLEEETVAQCTFSITIDSRTNRCCHINKSGGKALTSGDLFKCIQLAKNRASELKTICTKKGDTIMDCS